MSSVSLCYNGRDMARADLPEKTHRVTLDLPPALYERLRTLAFRSRDSMNKICNELLDEHLPQIDDMPDPTAKRGDKSAD